MPLDLFQQVFALSFASNLVNSLKGTQNSLWVALQRGLSQSLREIGEDWKLAWGPVVWKNEPDNANTGPDNSWYIAYHPTLQFEDGSEHPTYVVAIAGTPQGSLHAWTKQNIAVFSVADFKTWVAGELGNAPVMANGRTDGTAYIAKGTVTAIHLLLTTAAPNGSVFAGTTLLDFISTLDMSVSPRIIFTGYSLGGALSPSLALALVLADIIPAANALTYPIAGPSPGNVEFTKLFAETFPARKSSEASYKGWNLNLVNLLDVVPQAWCTDPSISPEQNLDNVCTLYGPEVKAVKGIAQLAGQLVKNSSVAYKPLPSQYFTGTPPTPPPTTLDEFVPIMMSQHTTAYTAEVGVTISSLDENQVLHSGLSEKTMDEIRLSYPVIDDFEWALEHPEEAEEMEHSFADTA